MKIIIFSSILLILLSCSLHSQIQNGGFEQWSSGEPSFWLSNNIDEPEFTITTITQSAFAHTGASSLHGAVVSQEINGVTVIVAPQVQAGNMTALGFPYSGKPKRIKGYYNLSLVGGDEFVNNVFLMNGNTVLAVGGLTKFASTGSGWHELVMDLFYIDSLTMPNKILFNFQIKPPDLQTDAHLGSAFYIDGFPSMSFIKPPGDMELPNNDLNVFIAGEKDTIKWEAGGALNVNLDYSIDDGATYQSIVTNYSADSNKYIWDVPASLLSRKAKIKLIETQNTSNKIKSKKFTIKPWQLTRIDAGDMLELFVPNQDGWVFSNATSNVWPPSWWQMFDYSGTDPITGDPYPFWFPFINANPSDFPDWTLFVDAFGQENCYVFGNSYRAEATTHWGGIFSGIRHDFVGSCFGFSITSLLGFYHKSSLLQIFPGIGNFSNLFNVPLGPVSRRAVNQFMVYQFSEEVKVLRATRGNYDPRILLQDLKDMFRKEDGDGRILYFKNNRASGAHEVTPYRLQRNGNTATFNLFVYDNRFPGNANAVIQIDSAANQWTDMTTSGIGFGTGNRRCYLEAESAAYLLGPTIPESLPNKPPTLNFPNLSSKIMLYNSTYADITISANNGGQIGFQDSVDFNSIIDAESIIPATTSYQPPIGYDLPIDSYSIQMNNFADSSSYVFFLSESTIYNFRRVDADINEVDILNYSENGIGIVNPDPVVKTTSLETIIIEDSSSEKIFVTTNVKISAGDSIRIRENNREELLFQNYGESIAYDLQVRIVSASGKALFSHTSITLSENTSHKIAPYWDDIVNIPIKIYIDNGNDGTIDDSTSIINQVTDINEQGSLYILGKYFLEQNYPNPFNPSTRIKYSIPNQNNVVLKVFDVLGNEIAELVNEEKPIGNYEVEFDASNLTSGVYFYRIQAGSFIDTKKMLLLR